MIKITKTDACVSLNAIDQHFNDGAIIGGKLSGKIVFVIATQYNSNKYRLVIADQVNVLNGYWRQAGGDPSIKDLLYPHMESGEFYAFEDFTEFARWIVENS